LVVVSLEPLLDSKNFHRQLHYLSGGDVDAKWTPLFPSVNFEHYECLQLHFWELFPQLIPHKTTTYWTNLHKLILGFVGLPHDAPFAWGNFARHVIELPLIPMHAPKHVSPDAAANGRITALFGRRLARLAQPPAAIICLGKDAVAMFETIGAGTLVEDLQGEPGHGFGPNFDDKVKTRLHHLDVGGAVVPLFLRNAPLTSGRQPRDPGTHALGALMRQRAATIA
jgi:hypothetical protein